MPSDTRSFAELCRARPGRAFALSLAPVLVAGAQGTNALVHGVTSPLVVTFVLVLLAFAVVATRHSLAAFEVESLEAAPFED